MSELKSYRGESSVDLSIRGLQNVEGLLRFCIDNGLALDHEETTTVERLVDDARKEELRNNRPLFPVKSTPKAEKIIAYSGQNIVDLALQETGSVEGLIAFLRANALAPISDPIVGQQIKSISADIVNDEVRSFYRSLNYKVNTSDSAEEELLGIGFMIVQSNFTVG